MIPAADTSELEARMYDRLSGIALLALGAANVVMQLAKLPVGHGVAQSKVESGRLDRHPAKRTRTTLAYVGISLFGTEEERRAYRQEVNRSHRQVHSEPGDEVPYDAFDKDLQLWVAACIFAGTEQVGQLFYPEATEPREAEAVYQHAARLGTTLQVPEEMWPPDREAFEEYWQRGLAEIEMDDISRGFLLDFIGLGFLPAPLQAVMGPPHRFVTTGFLPEAFREELGVTWTPRRQGLHDALTRAMVLANRLQPAVLRRFPFNFYLWDARRRIRKGRPIT